MVPIPHYHTFLILSFLFEALKSFLDTGNKAMVVKQEILLEPGKNKSPSPKLGKHILPSYVYASEARGRGGVRRVL